MDALLDRTCGERPRASRIGIVPRLDLPEDKVGPCNVRIVLWTNWDFGAASAADECRDLIFPMKLCCEYRICLRFKSAFGAPASLLNDVKFDLRGTPTNNS